MSRGVRFLIVADHDDVGAGRVAGGLVARRGAEARAVTPADLVFGAHVEYRAADGEVTPEITLADGAVIDPRALAVVLFRSEATMAPWAPRASPADAAYAAMEAYAFLLAWLEALSWRVVNRPSGTGLAGPAWTPIQWLAIAARVGLPVARARATTDVRTHPGPGWETIGAPRRSVARFLEPLPPARRRLLVTDGTVADDAFDPLRDSFRTLARTTACGLLAVTLAETESGPTVTAVDPVPALESDAEVHTVIDLLERLAADRPTP